MMGTGCDFLAPDGGGVLRRCGERVVGASLWARGRSERCVSHLYRHQAETIPTILDPDCAHCGQPRFAHSAPNDTACAHYDPRPGCKRMLDGTGRPLETRRLGAAR